MASYIVELDAVVVEVVQDCNTVFISFSVIGLGSPSSASIWPFRYRSGTIWPIDSRIGAWLLTASPEIWQGSNQILCNSDLLGIFQRRWSQATRRAVVTGSTPTEASRRGDVKSIGTACTGGSSAGWLGGSCCGAGIEWGRPGWGWSWATLKSSEGVEKLAADTGQGQK